MKLITDIHYLGEVVTSISNIPIHSSEGIIMEFNLENMKASFKADLVAKNEPHTKGMIAIAYHHSGFSSLFESTDAAIDGFVEEYKKCKQSGMPTKLDGHDYVIDVDISQSEHNPVFALTLARAIAEATAEHYNIPLLDYVELYSRANKMWFNA